MTEGQSNSGVELRQIAEVLCTRRVFRVAREQGHVAELRRQGSDTIQFTIFVGRPGSMHARERGYLIVVLGVTF
jgi:hypothetical protein